MACNLFNTVASTSHTFSKSTMLPQWEKGRTSVPQGKQEQLWRMDDKQTVLEVSKWSCTFLNHLSYKHLQSTWLRVQWLVGCVCILAVPSPHTRHSVLHGLDFEGSPVPLQSSWSRAPLGGMLLTPRSGRAFLQGPCRLSVAKWTLWGPREGENTPWSSSLPTCNPRGQVAAMRRRQSQRKLPTAMKG